VWRNHRTKNCLLNLPAKNNKNLVIFAKVTAEVKGV